MSYEARCPACGVEWSRHLGIAGTCADVVKLREEIRVLQERIRNCKCRADEERKAP